MNGYEKPLTPERIASVEDREIDFSDVPEPDDAFWEQAKRVRPDSPEPTVN